MDSDRQESATAAVPPVAPKAKPQEHHDEIPKDLHRPGVLSIMVAVLLLLVVLAGLFFLGWRPHKAAEEQARTDAEERASAVPIVSVAKPQPSQSTKDLTWPCNVRANQETAIYSRANGYLKTLHVDIGSRVKKGDLLAEIDTPDVDAQLEQSNAAVQQAKANVAKADADLKLAQQTLRRYQDLERSGNNTVTQQEVDEKQAIQDQAIASKAQAEANQKAAESALQRFVVLQGFEKIYAPFDGVITTRNYDVGALLSPTDIGPGKEIFRLAQTDPVRVFVNVPMVYSTSIRERQVARLEVRNYPGKSFEGTVIRKTDSIDPTTRVMAFEVDFPNSDASLVPGMYGTLEVAVSEAHPVLIIPTSALLFDAAGTRVALVQDGKIHLQPVKVGSDRGTEMEITDGLSKDDDIVSTPGERLTEGTPVQVQNTVTVAEAPKAPLAATH